MSDGSDAEVVAPAMEDDDYTGQVSPATCEAVVDESVDVEDADVSPNRPREETNSAAKSQLSSRASAFSIAALMARTSPREDNDNDEVEHVKDVDDISDISDDDDQDDVFADDGGDGDEAKLLRIEQNATTVRLGM